VSSASADTCPVPDGGSARLAAIDARERIAFIHRTETDQARYAQTWKWAWFGIGWGFVAAGAIQAAAWAAGDNVAREANIVDNLIVTGFSLVTPFAALLFSLRVESDAPAIDQLLKQTGDGAAGTCLVLARMEELLVKGGEEEAFNTAWFQHVIALLGVGAMFSIMAVEAATASNSDIQEAHWINAITNGVGGVIVTEAQLLTSPTGAASGYKRYLKGDLAQKKASWSVVPLGVASGIALRVVF
jgi:hypothetical protein